MARSGRYHPTILCRYFKSATLTCRISNIAFDQDVTALSVTWTQASDHKVLETVLGQPTKQENDLLFVDATATVWVDDWNNGEIFNCKVVFEHLLPTPEVKPLRKPIGGIHHPPTVDILPPPSDQLALRETATLTCLAKGFYPNEFFVKWFQNDEPGHPSEYFTSKATKKESKMPEQYFAYSMLNINEQDWSAGDSYSCVVGHEALPLQITQKTVDKNTGKPTIVNVSLVLSDTVNTCS